MSNKDLNKAALVSLSGKCSHTRLQVRETVYRRSLDGKATKTFHQCMSCSSTWWTYE